MLTMTKLTLHLYASVSQYIIEKGDWIRYSSFQATILQIYFEKVKIINRSIYFHLYYSFGKYSIQPNFPRKGITEETLNCKMVKQSQIIFIISYDSTLI